MIFGNLFFKTKEQKNGKTEKEKHFQTKLKEDEKISKIISGEKSMQEFEQKEVTLFYVEELHKEQVRVKHLQELAKYQLPIKAKIPGDERSYFTLIEKIVSIKGEYAVLMKEFENPKYKESLKPGGVVSFEYSDTAGKYSFDAQYKGVYKTSLVFSFPQKIERKSGRSAYRVKVDPNEPIDVIVELKDGITIQGRMVDINEYGTGIDVEIPKDKVKMLDPVKLAFRVPTKEGQKKHEWAMISAKGEIRFIGDSEQKKTRLGIQFTEILDDDRKNIREYWLMRQRQELRRKLEYES